ncbi:MAG: type I methionyl aminopeptidase [Chitinophagales bacterium]|nr:type I methionyl aminopeptidase [Chitinophagales bacterium]
MKKANKDQSNFFVIQNNEYLEKQRIAGSVVRELLKILVSKVNDSLTMLHLSKLAEEFILDNKCQPIFKGYDGFPEAVCISINNEAVHGIPKNIKLNEGDLVTFDLGATFDGIIADAATTTVCGNFLNKKDEVLVKATKEALANAINSIAVNKRLGCIGFAIAKTAEKYNLTVVENYAGHFIDINKPHALPFVANKDYTSNGIRFQYGSNLAIEPIFTLALNNYTKKSSDGWTILTNDKSAHEEHTVFVHENKVEIIT